MTLMDWVALIVVICLAFLFGLAVKDVVEWALRKWGR